MQWKIEILESAIKELKKLDKSVALEIINYFERKISNASDPTIHAKPLKHHLFGFWRMRIGDYRIIFRINVTEKLIQITKIGHRKDIYGK